MWRPCSPITRRSWAARERARLARLAEGSIGTALSLAAEDGVAIAGLVDEALAAPVLAGAGAGASPTPWRAPWRGWTSSPSS